MPLHRSIFLLSAASPPAVLPDDLAPPARFDAATFATYRPQTSSQEEALGEAQVFAERVRERRSLTHRLRQFVSRNGTPDAQGLYFVGPVGTGKTHLLAALYHALHPTIPCAFLHSSAVFRLTAPPDALADALAQRFDVLCLDEVEIDDPANEVRLVRLLRALEERGVVLFATSNVRPEQFLSRRMSQGRFQRFLQNEFSAHYRIVFVGGADYRQEETPAPSAPRGRGWIGPPALTAPHLRQQYAARKAAARWMSFADLREASRTTAHPRLIDRLARHDALFIADIAIRNTDDALRLLRIVDDLYIRPDAPRLFFSAPEPPEAWFEATAMSDGLARDIADKFTRTTSRLRALCTIEHVPRD